MSITKFSVDDINRLTERLSKIESELRALKMEDKAHHTAIKDGAFRVIDSVDNERARLGKISAGVYGIKIYDASGNLVQEITDSAVNAVKIVGTGVDSDGDILFSSLIVPAGRKVIFIVAPAGGYIAGSKNIWPTMQLEAGDDAGFMVLGTVLAASYKALGPTGGLWSYSECKWIRTVGTYSNIKLYARQVWYHILTDSSYAVGYKGMWVALEVAA